MTESKFQCLAYAGYNRIPCVLETLCDFDTPLSIYLKLANEPYSYLLESVHGGERFGRYSFIGLACSTRIAAYGSQVLVMTGDRVTEKSAEGVNPLDFIRDYLGRYRVAEVPGLPRFSGGLVGCFGYDTIRYIEPRLAHCPNPDTIGRHPNDPDSALPDVYLLVSEELAIVDNVSGKLTLVVYADPELPGAYQKAQHRLKELLGRLRQPVNIPEERPGHAEPPSSEMTKEEYEAMVEAAKHYIREGDIMQVVLSQRMSQPFNASPLSLYRALRALNPSPYMYYYHFDDFYVVGASPEILVRLENDTVTLRPIAGTRRRGMNGEEDVRLAEELLADPKERAEHTMLLDLGRNDVGKVSASGCVSVTEQMIIERYSHVMHLVSNVEGKLKTGEDAISVLRATFPAGTVSGAPKVRAMEIIDELEPSKRGLYAGAVGYLGFHGDMDLAIMIRTGIIKDGRVYVQAGGGIVADSRPAEEWMESMNKAKAVLKAAEMAISGLDVHSF